MKKCLAVLLALVLTLSFFTFTVSADDMEITPYAYACSACRNTMTYTLHANMIDSYVSAGCSVSSDHHVHYDIFNEKEWYCDNNDCINCGLVARRQTTIVESNICYLVRPFA